MIPYPPIPSCLLSSTLCTFILRICTTLVSTYQTKLPLISPQLTPLSRSPNHPLLPPPLHPSARLDDRTPRPNPPHHRRPLPNRSPGFQDQCAPPILRHHRLLNLILSAPRISFIFSLYPVMGGLNWWFGKRG
jgi:hypothetical protein